MRKYAYTMKVTLLGLFLGLTSVVQADSSWTIRHLVSEQNIVSLDVTEDYLLLPIQDDAPEGKICIVKDNEQKGTLMNVRLARERVDSYVPFELSAYKGQHISIDIQGVPANALCWKELKMSDSFDMTNKEMFRPVYHHTPVYGWMNDPNGMFYKDGVYHLFYKTEGHGNGIKVATTRLLTSGEWEEQPDYKQQTKEAVEGAGTFKLIGQDKYILMYDVYMKGAYQFTETTDLKNFKVIDHAVKMNFHPRHGTIIPITRAELKRITDKWGKPAELGELPVNPVLPGFHADPEVLYSQQTQRYYIYSTTDGQPGWGGWYFTVFSSADMKDWTYEGVMLDLRSPQVPWANGNAWAPAIEEKLIDGKYKYFFYYSGNPNDDSGKKIGVAVADSPVGPFKDMGKPIITDSPVGHGQQIDVDVFTDPVSGKSYLYWGNGYMAGAELNDDMVSIKKETLKVMTPKGGTLKDYAYREAPYVFYRQGLYYFLWSVDDTGSANYHVAYGTSDSPLGPIKVAKDPIVMIQDPSKEIYGTAHNSVVRKPGTDEWYIVYHRINKNYLDKDKGPGVHREVCIDRMEFNPDGTIKPVVPTP